MPFFVNSDAHISGAFFIYFFAYLVDPLTQEWPFFAWGFLKVNITEAMT
jgi:hypothetical protein